MAGFAGRLEVSRLRQRIEDAFSRAGELPADNFQLRSDMAKYLCVLVAGYVEKATQELTAEMCRLQSSPKVARYSSRQLKRLQNLNGERLKQLLASFDDDWRNRAEADHAEAILALDSLYGNRHLIAHGSDVGVTIAQVRGYYEQVQDLVEFMTDEMDPAP